MNAYMPGVSGTNLNGQQRERTTTPTTPEQYEQEKLDYERRNKTASATKLEEMPQAETIVPIHLGQAEEHHGDAEAAVSNLAKNKKVQEQVNNQTHASTPIYMFIGVLITLVMVLAYVVEKQRDQVKGKRQSFDDIINQVVNTKDKLKGFKKDE